MGFDLMAGRRAILNESVLAGVWVTLLSQIVVLGKAVHHIANIVQLFMTSGLIDNNTFSAELTVDLLLPCWDSVKFCNVFFACIS